MSLRTTQTEFFWTACEFGIWIRDCTPYDVTGGDLFRSPEEMIRIGHTKSQHGIRLAIDLNLFLDGVYLAKTEDHKPLGEKWVTLHDLACWGGEFDDGNHYSFEYWGRK